MNNNYEIIKDAILNKKQVKAEYKKHYREFCPHAIGTNKEGKESVICYQFAGSSSNGEITTQSSQNWKCLKLDKIIIFEVIEGDWHTFDNHSKPNTCIRTTHFEVEY